VLESDDGKPPSIALSNFMVGSSLGCDCACDCCSGG
jgi:hypothetical protein